MPRRAWRCLWIARELPFPRVSGDRVYSEGLAEALARTGVEVVFVAHPSPDGPSAEPGPASAEPVPAAAAPGPASAVHWRRVDGRPRHPVAVALASPLPVAAGIRATAPFRATVTALLDEGFDAIVIDQLGSGWVLDCLASLPAAAPRPVLLYLAHNHERTVWSSMARQNRLAPLRRLAVHRNATKVERLEARLLAAVDRVVAITDVDAGRFEADGAPAPVTVVTPGYSGPVYPPRTITDATPRRVVMVGSHGWIIKEENLRRFLEIADPRFAAAGIHFDLVGAMPAALATELGPRLTATTLHGYVEAPGRLFDQARLAVVPEMIGGGFKLKLLDYLFAGLPIATVAPAIAGLSSRFGPHMLVTADLDELVKRIIDAIDDPARLDRMQREARALAEGRFRWDDRGHLLRATLEGLVAVRRSQSPPSR